MAELTPVKVDTSRKIIHVDMDAFYASIEMRDHPEFVDVPLVIAKDPRKTGGHGVVATANYVARSFGIHSAMSAAEALKLAPKAVFKNPDFDLYRSVSEQIHEIFHEYTDVIEPIAFDEAYLDITENKLRIQSAVALAHRLQQEIWDKTHLTCSTGISYNKFLAKEGSDYRKPAGVSIILPEDAHDFLMALPIARFRGVGKKMAPRMEELGIHNGADLIQRSEMELIHEFGKFGYGLYRRVRGSDDRPVEWQRERKSIGKENTFNPVLTTEGEVDTQLDQIAQSLARSVGKRKRQGKTLVLKVRDDDFNTITKRVTQEDYIENDAKVYHDLAMQIYEGVSESLHQIRLLGITITNLANQSFEDLPLPLFGK